MPETRATGYYNTYLQGKREKMEESLALAENELINKYNADMSYRTELIARYNDITDEIQDYEKLIADMEEARLKARTTAKKAKAAGIPSDIDLLRERNDLLASKASAQDRQADRRLRAKTNIEAEYAPEGRLTSAVERLAPDIEASFIAGSVGNLGATMLRDGSLQAALQNATPLQKRNAAIHAKRMIRDLPASDQLGEDTLDTMISNTFGIPKGSADPELLLAEREQAVADADRKALTSSASQLGTAVAEVEGMMAAKMEAPGLTITPAPPEAATVGGEERSDIEIALINSLRDDGIISPEEERDYMRAVVQAGQTTAEMGVSPLNDYLESNIDDLFLQRVQSIGKLQAKRAGIEGGIAPPLPTAPTVEDVRARAAEIYYPHRSRSIAERLSGTVRQERKDARAGLEERMAAKTATEERLGNMSTPQRLLYDLTRQAQSTLSESSGILPDNGTVRNWANEVRMKAGGPEDLITLAGESARAYKGKQATSEQIREYRDEILQDVLLQMLHEKRSNATRPTSQETIETAGE